MRSTLTAFTLSLVFLIAPIATAESPLGSVFTYQGKLDLLGSPLNDTADFEFTLWDADVGPNMVGAVWPVNNVTVVDGLFTVEIEFGVIAFNGDNRWLEIAVRSPAGDGVFTTLSPRQPLTVAPYALQTRGIFVDDAGDVAIGTTVTGRTLTLQSRSAGDEWLSLFDSNGVLQWHINNSGDPGGLDFVESGVAAGRLHLSPGGNVGIGTTDPSATLDVVGTTELNGDVTINSNLTVDTDTLFVDGAAGQVGIGTTDPSEALEVVGTIAATAFVGDGSGLTGISGDDLGDHTATQNIAANGHWLSNDGDSEGVFIDGAGNVGIAELSPSATLDVVGTTELNGDVTINSNLTVDTDTLFVDGAAGQVGIGTTTPGGPLQVGNNVPITSSCCFEIVGDGCDDSECQAIVCGVDSFCCDGFWDLTCVAEAEDLCGDLCFAKSIFLITSSGNVGIGETSPSATLDVVGMTELNGNLAVDTDTLFVDSTTGQVGIGTTTPGGPLQVGDGLVNSDCCVAHASDGCDDSECQTIVCDENFLCCFFDWGAQCVALAQGLCDDHCVAESIFLITSSGNVGIGTTEPAGKLDVAGNNNSYFGGLRLNGLDGFENQIYQSNLDETLGITANGGPISFGQTSSQQMILTAGGNLGIGEAVPGFPLNFASTLGDKISLFGTSGGHYGFGVQNLTFQIHTDTSAADIVFGYGVSANLTETMRITGDGNVGIGRTPTLNLLEVEGEASKSTGPFGAVNSDRSIKTDIHTIDSALDVLDKIRLVSFEYTDDYQASHQSVGGGRYLNVVAQEFAEVFPEHVKGSGELLPDGSEILQVDTYPLTIYSAAAIQELHVQVRQSAAENEALRNANAMLVERMERLESIVDQLSSK